MSINKKHILIVEDSPDLQNLLVQLFEREGYTPFRASNGQQALDLLRSVPELPVFILLDIMMPVMDGIEFRQKQKSDPHLAAIPVIVMTADSEPEAKAIKLGAAHFFKKPLRDIDKLLDLVSSLSGSQSES